MTRVISTTSCLFLVTQVGSDPILLMSTQLDCYYRYCPVQQPIKFVLYFSRSITTVSMVSVTTFSALTSQLSIRGHLFVTLFPTWIAKIRKNSGIGNQKHFSNIDVALLYWYLFAETIIYTWPRQQHRQPLQQQNLQLPQNQSTDLGLIEDHWDVVDHLTTIMMKTTTTTTMRMIAELIGGESSDHVVVVLNTKKTTKKGGRIVMRNLGKSNIYKKNSAQMLKWMIVFQDG